ncbi:hypothetical protein RCL1_005062 [Eukaryota sp. TZLM3-RCL]
MVAPKRGRQKAKLSTPAISKSRTSARVAGREHSSAITINPNRFPTQLVNPSDIKVNACVSPFRGTYPLKFPPIIKQFVRLDHIATTAFKFVKVSGPNLEEICTAFANSTPSEEDHNEIVGLFAIPDFPPLAQSFTESIINFLRTEPKVIFYPEKDHFCEYTCFIESINDFNPDEITKYMGLHHLLRIFSIFVLFIDGKGFASKQFTSFSDKETTLISTMSHFFLMWIEGNISITVNDEDEFSCEFIK